MNFPSRTLYGIDNLRVLRGMDSETVDLIYLDPPFNKAEDFNSPLEGKTKADMHAFLKWFNAFNAENHFSLCDELLKWRKDFETPSFEDTWESAIDFRNMDGWLAELQEIHPRAYLLLEGLDKLSQVDRDYKGHLSYLAFMSVRLVEMRRILKPTGAVYLHCDDTMSHWLKILMDAIFGAKSYRNHIIWKRTGAHNDPKKFGRNLDHILYYGKSEDTLFNVVYTEYDKEYIKQTYNNYDEKLGQYKRDDMTGTGLNRNDKAYKGFHPASIGRHWAINRAKVEELAGKEKTSKMTTIQKLRLLDKAGYIHWSEAGKPTYKRPLADMKGKPLQTDWMDISNVAHSKERTGYPTQKPLKLLERIILSSSKEGDLVLDPFCGCATTCIAAHKLGRRYVGIDVSKASYILNIYRLYRDIWGWKKDDMFNGAGVSKYADHTPRYAEKAPRRSSYEVKDKGFVYVVSNSVWPGEYKVGITKQPAKCMTRYNTGDPKRAYQLAFSMECLNYREIEAAVHEEFPGTHEWVKGDLQEIIAFVKDMCKTS